MTSESKQFRLSNDPAMPRSGDLLKERYRIESPLGEGGFAAVFRAQDTTTGAHVAIKVLDPIMSRRDEFAQRFLREVETISALTHYNTIRVTDKGETPTGCLFLVMELLTGGSLDDLIAKNGPMPEQLVQRVALQVLRSLNEAHSKNIIHRDIKPANIFLVQMPGENDHVKVLDFGIAKSLDGGEDAALTSTGQVMCSPHYVAPERVVDHITFPSSDIYSLGVSMVEMLEGAPPYQSDTPIQLVMKHARLDDPVPMLPSTEASRLAPIIRKATAKDYRQRYQSAQEMIDDLLRLEKGSTIVGVPLPPPPATEERGRFNPMVLIAFLVALVGTLAIVKFATSRGDQPPTADTNQQVDLNPVAEDNDALAALVADPSLLEERFDAPVATPFLIDSMPSGAVVFANGQRLGETPLRLGADTLPAVPFTLDLEAQDGRRTSQRIENLTELKSLLVPFPTANPLDRGQANAADSQDPRLSTDRPPDTNASPSTPSASAGQGTSSTPNEPTAPQGTANTLEKPSDDSKASANEPEKPPRNVVSEPSTPATRPTTPPTNSRPSEPSTPSLPSIPDLGGSSGGGSYFGGR